MAPPIRTTTDLVCYVNGTDMAGHASSIEFEPIEFEKSDENRLGLFGTPRVTMGLPPVIVAITWKSLLIDWSEISGNPFEGFLLQFRGNITETDSTGRVADLPMAVEITGISEQHPMGAEEAFEPGEYETSFAITRFLQTIDGAPAVEYDLYAYLYSVGGTDLLADRRANLGI